MLEIGLMVLEKPLANVKSMQIEDGQLIGIKNAYLTEN